MQPVKLSKKILADWEENKNGDSPCATTYYWKGWMCEKVMAYVYYNREKRAWAIKLWEMGKTDLTQNRKEWRGRRVYKSLKTALFKASLYVGDCYYQLFPEQQHA